MKILKMLQEECTIEIKEQIFSLMKEEWPEAFEGLDEEILWPDSLEINPVSFVLILDGIVMSHVAVVSKEIEHEGEKYTAYGLSEVMTNSLYRKRGYGLLLIQTAYSYIKQQGADVSIFTCDPHLVPFYKQGGWEQLQSACLVGGTRRKPFRSDSLEKCTMVKFFSEKAQKNRDTFEEADIYLELREKQLW
ncbi:GNAT family N-acetyltransferase [Bacillus manliponensis]|nr:GNAT family N-acetyltransferase [Bacillus manliponensis]